MCSSSVKDMGILIGIVLNLWIAFGSMDILTRLILQSENMGYLFICLNHIQFSLSMLYHFQHINLSNCWLSFFLGFYFCAILNKIAVLLSLLNISYWCKEMQQISVYSTCTSYFMEFAYQISQFYMEILRFYLSGYFIQISIICRQHKILSISCYLQIVIILPLSFPFRYLFFLSSDCYARTTNTILNRSSESGNCCLIPEFSRNGFSFSSWIIMLAVGLL